MTGENNRQCASIAMQPGTAARVPNEQARDVRGHRAAAKVRAAFRQASNPFLEAKEKNLRCPTRQQADEPATNDRREFVFLSGW